MRKKLTTVRRLTHRRTTEHLSFVRVYSLILYILQLDISGIPFSQGHDTRFNRYY